ncbi:DUF5590 domain-containing protein [Lacticaseibacillus sp. N501-2]|uniref:cell wall elongation regulator TseB-like domain-containing protein n=1 Tax=Lacticaseibacillus salsurae TaxID=3367729 RepID=UPI0038B3E913
MRRANRRQWQKQLWVVVGLVLIAMVLGIYQKGLAPMRAVRKQAISIAEKKAAVQTVSAFYWDKQRDSYVTVAGTTKTKQKVYVLIRQKTGHMNVLRQSSGTSMQQAQAQAIQSYAPKKILSVGLSIRKQKYVWDVGYRSKSGKLGYVTYDFKTGDELFAVANL